MSSCPTSASSSPGAPRPQSSKSVKAASEVFAPIAGEVIEVNGALADAPATVNEAPESDGWFLKLKVADARDFDSLMDAKAYHAYLETI